MSARKSRFSKRGEGAFAAFALVESNLAVTLAIPVRLLCVDLTTSCRSRGATIPSFALLSCRSPRPNGLTGDALGGVVRELNLPRILIEQNFALGWRQIRTSESAYAKPRKFWRVRWRRDGCRAAPSVRATRPRTQSALALKADRRLIQAQRHARCAPSRRRGASASD